MIPKRVILENFLSFGKRTEIAFDDDSEPLWVLGGSNGVGKSAVFDAITYCLFGSHRGGLKGGQEHLIHHGASGFNVSFEFGFGDTDYRIARNYSNRPTQSVETKGADGEWIRVPHVNGVAEMKDWAEHTLGLNFEAFQASVLLRQGEADKIVNADGKTRLGILKKIIGVERYEDLWTRVNEASKAKKRTLADLQQSRSQWKEVRPEELAAAEAEAVAAEAAKGIATDGVTVAVERLQQAKRFGEVERQRIDLGRKFADAKARAGEADRIKAQYARVQELDKVLPTLRLFLPLRGKVAASVETIAQRVRTRDAAVQAKDDAQRLHLQAETQLKELADAIATHAREAKGEREEHERSMKFHTVAEELAGWEKQALRFPTPLDAELIDAEARHEKANEMLQSSRDARARCSTLLQTALEHKAKTDALAVGIKCSSCGREVDAEHAANERAIAASELVKATAELQLAERNWQRAQENRTFAKASHGEYARIVAERNALRQRIADKHQNLKDFGISADISTTHARIESLKHSLAERERLVREAFDEQKRLNSKLPILASESNRAAASAEAVAKEHDEAERRTSAERVKCETLGEQLGDPWRTTTTVELASLGAEARELAGSGIHKQYEQLQNDVALRDEWERQLADSDRLIEAIPDTARIPTSEAEAIHRATIAEAKRADTAWHESRDRLAELKRNVEALQTLKTRITLAEQDASTHAKLDKLLGKAGLQRELVRDAESRIVELADDTVRKLSDGDLSIELRDGEGNDDEALVLLVRRADDPIPIPVEYLSGSQKFRVAVALALAIGRFASGRARPIECVIIDEGFGSLDKDGLRASADELNRLKQHLKRIIIVSHQDDFTEQFPVLIRLSKGVTGTFPEKIRR